MVPNTPPSPPSPPPHQPRQPHLPIPSHTHPPFPGRLTCPPPKNNSQPRPILPIPRHPQRPSSPPNPSTPSAPSPSASLHHRGPLPPSALPPSPLTTRTWCRPSSMAAKRSAYSHSFCSKYAPLGGGGEEEERGGGGRRAGQSVSVCVGREGMRCTRASMVAHHVLKAFPQISPEPQTSSEFQQGARPETGQAPLPPPPPPPPSAVSRRHSLRVL